MLDAVIVRLTDGAAWSFDVHRWATALDSLTELFILALLLCIST